MTTLGNLASDSSSFGSPINLQYTSEDLNLNQPANDQMLLLVIVDQYDYDNATFLRFRTLKLNSGFTIQANSYYWYQYVPQQTGSISCLGFFNAMTNHVDQWYFDVWGNIDPSTVIVNPRFGDYLPIVPKFYEDKELSLIHI